MRLACDGEDREDVELVLVEEVLDAVVADVEHALHLALRREAART